MVKAALRQIKALDEQRPSFPGEHWMVFAAGLGLWLATRRHPSTAVRLAATLAGGLLVARAASGRDAPQALRRLVPHRH
jgi:hypothetical protein